MPNFFISLRRSFKAEEKIFHRVGLPLSVPRLWQFMMGSCVNLNILRFSQTIMGTAHKYQLNPPEKHETNEHNHPSSHDEKWSARRMCHDAVRFFLLLVCWNANGNSNSHENHFHAPIFSEHFYDSKSSSIWFLFHNLSLEAETNKLFSLLNYSPQSSARWRQIRVQKTSQVDE